MPVSARSSVERWECSECGRVLLPGEQKPRRSYHHTRGERCDGEWQKVRYVRESKLRAKLDEMELHDDLPDSFDMGYMAAWREINDALNAS